MSLRESNHVTGRLGRAFGLAGLLVALSVGCGSEPSASPENGANESGGSAGGEGRVVIYSALDEVFSKPLLEEYAEQTGVRVEPKFDIESTKTFGLVQAVITEASRPRCDLFWNNEIIGTLRLKRLGLLQPFEPAHASEFPENFRGKDGTWYGFAARARILLVNTEVVPEAERPTSIQDLLDPKWKGKIGIAKPLFGSTRTHVACLYAHWGAEKAEKFLKDLKANDVQVLSGNIQVAQAVGQGQLAFGLTDTDDALGELGAGSPVTIVYPDREPDQLGTLFIPNTLAMIKGAPHPEEARRLADYLYSSEIETKLAEGPSGQIPLNENVHVTLRVETPRTVHAMPADFEKAADLWDEVATYLIREFGGAGE